jgi:hypothetical protein
VSHVSLPQPGPQAPVISSPPGTDADVRARENEPSPYVQAGPPAYVTEISVPSFGDGGIQRLHSRMLPPEPELEA